jgi:hypothetical protein
VSFDFCGQLTVENDCSLAIFLYVILKLNVSFRNTPKNLENSPIIYKFARETLKFQIMKFSANYVYMENCLQDLKDTMIRLLILKDLFF